MDFVEALDIKSLPPGSHTVISISGKEVLLFNIDGEISAIGNICLHKEGPLSEGKVEKKYDGHYVTCPWHGWEYNVKTGAAPPGFGDQQALYDTLVKDNKIFVSALPRVLPLKAEHKDNPLQDLVELRYESTRSSLNILGISCTNMNQSLPRKSTSDEALRDALEYGSEKYNASTVLLKLSDLEFRHCEGYYSRNEQACTWPCSISEMDSNDGMNEVYRKLILWADILVLSTPIRWGNASSLYYKMAERLNCVQNQITLQDRVLVRNKVASFIITGGQDNIQQVAGQMMVFFTDHGITFPPDSILGWSRGWTAEDMDKNVLQFKRSEYIQRTAKELVDNSIETLCQVKHIHHENMKAPKPHKQDSLTADLVNQDMNM